MARRRDNMPRVAPVTPEPYVMSSKIVRLTSTVFRATMDYTHFLNRGGRGVILSELAQNKTIIVPES